MNQDSGNTDSPATDDGLPSFAEMVSTMSAQSLGFLEDIQRQHMTNMRLGFALYIFAMFALMAAGIIIVCFG
jgi:hypothetical protein